MEHKIILKCRVCLDDFDEAEMFELFAANKCNRTSEATVKLSEKVEYCCGVKIRESTEMPSKICIKCFDMTRIWYNFRQLCINSQVYLESLCTDRDRPKEGNDSDYLEFLFEDLQIFRHEARKENAGLDINLEESESEKGDFDTSDEFYESVPLDGEESEGELAHIIQNIKTEEDVNKEKKNSINEEENHQQGLWKKKTTNWQKQSGSFIPKKRYRPPSPSIYMCSICGNVYSKKASFAYHMSMHSNVRPHECELCGKSFRQTSELKNHMRRHTGERPYKCAFCERRFIDRSEKHRHERVHTNTRPYVCNVCGKSFMYSAILKNHSKLHSGEKEYNCLICHKAFTLHHQLKAHLQTITHKQKEAQFVGEGYEVMYE